MLINNEVIAIPAKVVQNYSKHITDKEFMALLHLLAANTTGKKAHEIAAATMGYSSIGAFNGLLNSMVEKGAIAVEKYQVDVSPLWSWCIGDITPAEQPKPKKDNTHYVIAGAVKNYSTTTNTHALAGVVKRLLTFVSADDLLWIYPLLPEIRQWVSKMTKEEDLVRTIAELSKAITQEEILVYIKYCYDQSTARKGTWVPTVYNLVNWLPVWLDRGKPKGDAKAPSIEELLAA